MKLWMQARGGQLEPGQSVLSCLGLDKAAWPVVISLIGSGGKTSLMGQLAKEGIEKNKRVAVLTTTKIKKPPRYREVFCDIKKGTVEIFGTDTGLGKLRYPGDDCYHKICAHADLILVEADGSQGLPVKAPASQEPVIPGNSNVILILCGLSALGKPGAAVCHRWPLAKELLADFSSNPDFGYLHETEIAALLTRGYQKSLRMKYPQARSVFCLNQVDSLAHLDAAARLMTLLEGESLAMSLQGAENILYPKSVTSIVMVYLASGFGQRFGANKLLTPFAGSLLYQHGLVCLHQAAALLAKDHAIKGEIVVVSQYHEILDFAKKMGCQGIYNQDSSQGITASIRLGLEAAAPADAFLFAVADQPRLKPQTVSALVAAFAKADKGIACLGAEGKRGNPVIFSSQYQQRLRRLEGDRGGSQIMALFPEDITVVTAPAIELMDVDSIADLKKLEI